MTIVLVIAITFLVLLVGIFCALIILYLFRRREKKRGKNMKDLITRKHRLENEDDTESDEEETNEAREPLNPSTNRDSLASADPNHYTGTDY